MAFQCDSILSLKPIAGEVRRNRFVTIGAAGAAEAAADADTHGIARDDSEDGSVVALSVMKKDGAIGEIEAGGVIAIGDVISSGADGVALSGAGNPQGVALEAAAAAGEIISIWYGN